MLLQASPTGRTSHPPRPPWPWLTATLLSFLFSLAAPSTHAQYRFDFWTTDNGLPQNSVYAITQTRDGYIWLTTLDGLVRYDGVRFTIFDKSNTKGITSNRFTSLYEDRDGALWAGLEDGGLTRYQHGAFTTFTTADGLPDNWVREIQGEPDGGVLIFTQGGVCRFNNGRFTPTPERGGLNQLRVKVSPSGARWTWDKEGLRRQRADRLTTYPIPLIITGDFAAALYEDRQGALWAAASPAKVFRVKESVVTSYTERDGLPPGAGFWAMCEDRQGNLWLGTGGSGLARFKDGRFTVYTTAHGLSSNVIRAVFEDREGTIWIGTGDGGLNRLSRQFITAYSTKDGLAANNVYPIYEDHAGDIWIGTARGLSRFSAGVFTNYLSEIGPHPLRNVQTIGEDRAGRLWVGNYGGVGRLKNGSVIRQPELAGNYAFRAVHQDRRGDLWFATERGVLKYAGGAVTAYTTKDGLPSNDARLIHEDRQGRLWFGFYGGLARFESGRFVVFTTKDGLASDHIRALHEDRDGALWIGTYDGGLSRFRDGRFVTCAMAHGLFNNGVFQILEDARGAFWISCNRGIYRVSKQQLNDFADGKLSKVTCVAYGKLDGMLNTECNGGRQPAGIKARDGRLWFPTLGGVVIVDPEAVPFNAQPPPVLIESVVIDGARAPFLASARVEPGQANLEINYTGLSYTKPEQAQFKYKLTGQDHDWVEAGTRRAAYYSYLQPGRYTFTVLAANSDGVWNNEGASIEIVVVPPFWRTWWFLAVSALAVGGMVFAGYRRRVARLHRRHAAQEAFSRQLIESQERERQRIAAELHDSLGQNLLVIKNRALLGSSAPTGSAALEQLAEITAAAAESLSEVRAIAYNLRPIHLERLGLTATLEEMIENIAAASGIEFEFAIAPLDGLFDKDDEINLFRIVQECLNNIVKHSRARQASVVLQRSESEARITISDDGAGFDPASPAPANGPAPKAGLGLTGLGERARMLRGSLQLQSALGRGTIVLIKIPLPAKHPDKKPLDKKQ